VQQQRLRPQVRITFATQFHEREGRRSSFGKTRWFIFTARCTSV